MKYTNDHGIVPIAQSAILLSLPHAPMVFNVTEQSMSSHGYVQGPAYGHKTRLLKDFASLLYFG